VARLEQKLTDVLEAAQLEKQVLVRKCEMAAKGVSWSPNRGAIPSRGPQGGGWDPPNEHIAARVLYDTAEAEVSRFF
jgi:hypothetical protein